MEWAEQAFYQIGRAALGFYIIVLILIGPPMIFTVLTKILRILERVDMYVQWHAKIEQKRLDKQFPNDRK